MNVLSFAELHACVHGASPCFLSALPLHPFARRSLQHRELLGHTVSRSRCAFTVAPLALASSMQQAELTQFGKYVSASAQAL